MRIPQASLDQVEAIKHLPAINALLKAMSAPAMYAIKRSASRGLTLTLYGGNFPGGVEIPEQRVALTPSATNYIYADADGVVHKVTSAPVGWPGSFSGGAKALYQLTVGANAVTSGTPYLTSRIKGPRGPTGAQGESGLELGKQRRFQAGTLGAGDTSLPSNVADPFGMDFTTVGGGVNARSLATTTFRETVPYVFKNINGANARTQIYSTNNFLHRGDAAGRGGFDITFEWGIESSFSTNNTFRSFIGLWVAADVSAADPSGFTNIIGIGGDSGDSNFYLLHNDASGSATKTLLTSNSSPSVNFPYRNTDNLYLLRLWCAANASGVNYRLTCPSNDAVAEGTITTNLPAGSTFLGCALWAATAATTSTIGYGFMKIAGYSRY